MLIKSTLKIVCIALLVNISGTAFAANEIKCPSPEYVKSNFAGTMNTIKRREPKTFAAESDQIIYDYDNKLYWITRTAYVTTAEDYDFNEAHKLAEISINNIAIAKTKYAEGYPGLIACTYLDKNENTLAYLVDASIGT
jgi:hypothetical protein